MIKLTALDIKKKEFDPKMRGFDPDEVKSFLGEASESVEILMNENETLHEKVKSLEARLEHYLSIEQTLERTLVAAQQTAVSMEENAKQKAELMLKEAELQRDRATTDLRVAEAQAKANLFQLQTEYESTLARMKSLLAGFSRFVESIETANRPLEATNSHNPENDALKADYSSN